MRSVRRVILATVFIFGGVMVGATPADAATFNWSHSCGWGNYWDVATRSAAADVDGAVAGLCKVKAHARCRHPDGGTLGTYGPTWRGVNDLNSVVACPSSFTRTGIGVAILA